MTPDMVDKQVDTLFKVAHQGTFKTSVQALLLLLQCLGIGQSGFQDRFYTAIYSKLSDPELLRVSKPALFLNLVYRAMKQDTSPSRGVALAKRVLQVGGCHGSAGMAAGVVFLLSAVTREKPELLLGWFDCCRGFARGQKGEIQKCFDFHFHRTNCVCSLFCCLTLVCCCDC